MIVPILNSRALIGALTSQRYGELEKKVQKETDSEKRAALQRDLRATKGGA